MVRGGRRSRGTFFRLAFIDCSCSVAKLGVGQWHTATRCAHTARKRLKRDVATMKVSSTGNVRSAATRRSRKGSKPQKASFSVAQPQVGPASTVGGANPVAPVAAMLALQEAPDPTDGRSRGLLRGSELLRYLDQIHLGLLSGGIPRHILERLAADLSAAHRATGDPRLSAILDEIELRARVELAKYDNSR